MKRILAPALLLLAMFIAGPASAAPRAPIAAKTTTVTARAGAVTVTRTTTTTTPVRVNERPRVAQRPAPRVVVVKRDGCDQRDRGHERHDRRDHRRRDHRHDHR